MAVNDNQLRFELGNLDGKIYDAPTPNAMSMDIPRSTGMSFDVPRSTGEFPRSTGMSMDFPRNVVKTEDSRANLKEYDAQADVENPPPPPKPKNPWQDVAAFPDGGAEAWLVVLGCWCCLFVSFGWIGCIGVFQQYYKFHQLKDLSASTVSWIPSLEACFLFLGGTWVGRIFDYYGPRGLIAGGTFLQVFGLMMASLSSKYYQFILSQSICSSIGASMVFYPAFSCLATWFHKKRALVFGIAATGSSLGGVLFPIIVLKMTAEVGFPWTMRTCAFLILFMLIIANFTVKARIPPTKSPVRIMDFIVPMKELTFNLLCLSQFLTYLGLFIPFNFITAEAISKGMGRTTGVYLVSILNGVSTIGRIVPPALADKYGRFNILIIQSAVAAISVLAIWIPGNSNAAYIVNASVFGFASGTIVSLTPAIVAQISDVRKIGVRTGTLYTFVAIAVLIGNPIAGQLISQDKGSYVHLQIFSGLTMAGGTAVLVITRINIFGWDFFKLV